MGLTGDADKTRLPRRDFILIPLIVLATVILALGGGELVTRALYPSAERDSCKMPDPVLGYRFQPNCVSRLKTAEGPWTVNRYNACGYRTPEPCGPTPAGSLRVAMIGSSTSYGYLVRYEDSLAARAANTLTSLCKRPVEIQNLGGVDYTGALLVPRTVEALTLKPATIVFVVSPFDLEITSGHEVKEGQFTIKKSSNPISEFKDVLLSSSLMATAQHFIMKDNHTFVSVYLLSGSKADFIRAHRYRLPGRN